MLKNFLKKVKGKRLFFLIPFVLVLSLILIYVFLRKPLYQMKATVKTANSFGLTPTSNEVLSRVLANLGMLDTNRPDISIAPVRSRISLNKDQSSGIVEIIIRGSNTEELSKLTKEITNTYVAKINAKSDQLKKTTLEKKEQEMEEYKKNLKEQLLRAKEQLEKYEKEIEELRGQEGGVVERVSDLKEKLAELENLRSDLLRVYTPAYPQVVRLDSEIAAIKEKLNALPKEPEGRLKLEREFKENQKIYNALKEKWDEVKLTKIEELKDTGSGATVINYAERPVLVTDVTSRKLIISRGILLAVLIGLLVLFLAVFLDTSMVSTDEVFAFTHLPVMGNIPSLKQFSFKEIKNKAGLLLEYGDKSAIIEPYRLLYMQIQSSISDNSNEGKSIFLTSAVTKEGKSTIASNLSLMMAKAGKKTLIIDTNLANPGIHLLFGIKDRLPGFTDVLNKGINYENAMRDVTDLLLGDIELKAALKFKGLDRLKIIPAGSPVSDATELLRSQNMRELMAELKKHFDYIILDGPSILNRADSVIIASQCDATLLVYLAGKTQRGSLKSTLTRLAYRQEGPAKAQISLRGVVINQCI